MDNFAGLMQRLIEIQVDGRPRSPELIAEDKRLMDGLQEKYLLGKTQTDGADYPDDQGKRL
jgi:hypothetical protein